MRANTARTVTLDGVDVECTQCGVRMTPHQGSSGRVRYFRCACCHRWVSSTYADVLRADAKLRATPLKPEPPSPAFDAVRSRLERFLAAIDDQDPYRLLGASPLEDLDAIRERYRALALVHHPDRGGSAERMQALNEAWERIVHHRARRRLESLGEGGAAQALSA